MGGECFVKNTAIWRDKQCNILVAGYYSCIPLQKPTKDVFWLKKIVSQKNMPALQVVYDGTFSDLPESNTAATALKVTCFKVKDYDETDPRIKFLLSDEPRCVICKLKEQTHDDLCHECNQRIAFFIGKISRHKNVKFSRKKRNELVARIVGALSNV